MVVVVEVLEVMVVELDVVEEELVVVSQDCRCSSTLRSTLLTYSSSTIIQGAAQGENCFHHI